MYIHILQTIVAGARAQSGTAVEQKVQNLINKNKVQICESIVRSYISITAAKLDATHKSLLLSHYCYRAHARALSHIYTHTQAHSLEELLPLL